MALARPLIRTILIVSVLAGLGYVLRPVAWEVEARLHDAKELLYKRVSRKFERTKQGFELPLATDENGLRLDVLEKIGSEELAKQELLKKKDPSGSGLPGRNQKLKRGAGPLIHIVDQAGLPAEDEEGNEGVAELGKVKGLDSEGLKEEVTEVQDDSLFSRLTKRGTWRGIVEPYVGKPRKQVNADGHRTSIADVDSSDDGGAAVTVGSDEAVTDGSEGADGLDSLQGEAVGARAKRTAVESRDERGRAALLEALMGDTSDGADEVVDGLGGLSDGSDDEKSGEDGEDFDESEEGPEADAAVAEDPATLGMGNADVDADVKGASANVGGTKKEGVKQFLDVNADLTSGSGDDEAVTGGAGLATGKSSKRGGKPKPREVAQRGGAGENAGPFPIRGGKPKPREVAEQEGVADSRWSGVLERGVNQARKEGGDDSVVIAGLEESADNLGSGSASVRNSTTSARKIPRAARNRTASGNALASAPNRTASELKLASARNRTAFGSNLAPARNRSASADRSASGNGSASRNRSVSLGDKMALLRNASVSLKNTSAAVSNRTSPLSNTTGLFHNRTKVNGSSLLGNISSSSAEGSVDVADSSPFDDQSTVKKWPLVEAMKHAIWEAPAAGVEMPPREEFTLRRELVQYWARDNTIVVTFANFAFLDFTTNWVRHLTDLGIANILVGAMDEEILEALFFAGVPVFDMKSEMYTGDAGWGSAIFHKMGRERLYLVDALLSFDVELLMCDTDMVFLRDPLEYVSRYPQADVLTSSDQLVHTVDDESLERWQEAHGAYNIGIIHYRPTTVTKAFAREWLDVATKDDLVWDQNAFNDIMRRELGPATEDGNGLVYAYDRSLKLGILPVSLFCSGHTYFVQQVFKATGLEPISIHTTFQYGGTEGKRHRLREAKVFNDEPEYYDPEGGLLAYEPDIPTELLTGGEHSVETHFALVNHQLLQLRDAFALAQVLNRTLVLPELWCRFDRLWYPHNGVLEGTATPQPFVCPADHILEIHKMVQGLPSDQFGPDIPFREYSLLDNPRLPKKVSASKVDVFVCDKGDAACKTSRVRPGSRLPKRVALERNSTDSQVRALLEPYRDTKLVSFSGVSGAFSGFEDKVVGEHFRARMKQYVAIWCCVHANPGHIYYDMYWDEKPGWMPKPPKDPSEDHPPLRLH